MTDTWIIGAASTAFSKFPHRSFRDLSEEVVSGAVRDAGLDRGEPIQSVWFGNCGMQAFGQANIRGQAALIPLVAQGWIPERVPIANVEGGCATGSLAFRSAVRDVQSGEVRCALAVAAEKTIVPDNPMATLEVFRQGVDQLHTEDWLPLVQEGAERVGLPFELRPERILFLDTYAMQALEHMKRYGTTARQLAVVASKNHYHGSLNPKAQYRFEVSVEKALEDRVVAGPLTRSMCCPVSDGAAAVLVCNDDVKRSLSPEAQARAVKIRAVAMSGGKLRRIDEESLTGAAAQRAFARAGIGPRDIDVAEVHDSTSFCEIYQAERLGFCPEGQGGPWSESGASALDGEVAINPSGGLLSKGHPLAATGLGMLEELVVQLRGEAGDRQVADARLALQQNAGGLIGLDEALCSVVILERS